MNNIFKLDERNKVAVLIDGVSLFTGARALSARVDYKLLLAQLYGVDWTNSKFQEPLYDIIDIRYYNHLVVNKDDDQAPMKALFDWLAFNSVYTCLRERQSGDTQLSHFSVDITVDALNLSSTVEHFVFFANDNHLLPLFQELRRRGKRLTLVCAHKLGEGRYMGPPAPLRQIVHQFIELANVMQHIADTRGVVEHA